MESSIILIALFGSLILVLGVVLHFQKNIVRNLMSTLNFIFPEKEYPEARRLKSGIVRAIIFVIGVVFLIFLISLFFSVIQPAFLADNSSTNDAENKLTGPLGDLFNGIATPILTFMTFCGLLITIIMQQAQLRMTLKEMRESNEMLQKQLTNSETQKFENNFYSMLNFQSKILDEIKKSHDVEDIINDSLKSYGFWMKKNHIFTNFTSINFGLLKYISDHRENKSISNSDAQRHYLIVSATIPPNILPIIFIAAINDLNYKNLLNRYRFKINADWSPNLIGHEVMKKIAENGIDLLDRESRLITSMTNIGNVNLLRFIASNFDRNISNLVKRLSLELGIDDKDGSVSLLIDELLHPHDGFCFSNYVVGFINYLSSVIDMNKIKDIMIISSAHFHNEECNNELKRNLEGMLIDYLKSNLLILNNKKLSNLH